MIDFTPYLNDDRLPVMNTDQFNYITEKYGKEKFREELSEYISQARPPFPFKKISKQDMITNFLDLKSFDTSKNIKSKSNIEKTVFEKYDDYKYSFDEYGLGLIEGANTYNTVSNYFMQELRLNCSSYGFRAPVDVWQNGNAKDIWRCFGPIWRGINTNNTLDEKVYMSAFRLGTYIATQFKPVVAKAIYDLTNANKVLDTSCGWGDRLAGFYTSNAKEYIGCDPNPNTFAIYMKQVDEYERILGNNNPIIKEDRNVFTINASKKVTIYRCGAEDLPWDDINDIDCSFTSPPYFSTEEYNKGGEHEEDQSWHKFNEYDKWRDNFFLPVSEQCIKKSKHTLINIMDPKIKGKRYRTGDEICDKYSSKYDNRFKGQIGMRIMQRPKSDKLFKDEQEKKEFMNNIFIENIWYFSNENTDLFKKSTLDEFFA
tara:strand:+ start:17 stop:1300 length:1284 start_codon:yes stop_codon:yes gene_type:complete